MQALSSDQHALYKKIAGMMALNCSQAEIARATSLTDGRISQIVNDAIFQEHFKEQAAELTEQQELINQGWDAVEEKAIAGVLAVLQWNKDPDYALRAAAVANKAQRRGSDARQPLGVANAGPQVIVNMPIAFLEKTSELQVTPSSDQDLPPKKQVSALRPSQVETMLGGSETGPVIEQEPEEVTADDEAREIATFADQLNKALG